MKIAELVFKSIPVHLPQAEYAADGIVIHQNLAPPKYNQFVYHPPGGVLRKIGCTPTAAAMFLAGLQIAQFGNFYYYGRSENDPKDCWRNDFSSSIEQVAHCPDVGQRMVDLHLDFNTRPSQEKNPHVIPEGITSAEAVTRPLTRIIQDETGHPAFRVLSRDVSFLKHLFNSALLDSPQIAILHIHGDIHGEIISTGLDIERHDIHHSAVCYGYDFVRNRAAISLGWGRLQPDIWLELDGIGTSVNVVVFDDSEPEPLNY